MVDQFDSPIAFLQYLQEIMRMPDLNMPGGDEHRTRALDIDLILK